MNEIIESVTNELLALYPRCWVLIAVEWVSYKHAVMSYEAFYAACEAWIKSQEQERMRHPVLIDPAIAQKLIFLLDEAIDEWEMAKRDGVSVDELERKCVTASECTTALEKAFYSEKNWEVL